MKVLVVLDNIKYIPDVHGFIERAGLVDATLVAVSNVDVDDGFDRVYKVGDVSSDILVKLGADVDGFDLYLAPHSKKCIEALSFYAGSKGIPIVTEVVDYSEEEGRIFRNILSGRGLVSYKFVTPMAITVASGKFKGSISRSPEVVERDVTPASRLIATEEKKFGGVDIENADIVVGVGRGFKAKEDLDMAFELAKILGGEVGCSRPIAADYHWLDEDRWIGISGKKIRGKLYIAIGISGAPQHIMAANDVKVIVAINKDKNAPIFEYTDYGVVADLYQFLPVFLERLKSKLGV